MSAAVWRNVFGKISEISAGILDNKIEMIEKSGPTRSSHATPVA
jgi:hypothetical protein